MLQEAILASLNIKAMLFEDNITIGVPVQRIVPGGGLSPQPAATAGGRAMSVLGQVINSRDFFLNMQITNQRSTNFC
jgi:hypothetical protein